MLRSSMGGSLGNKKSNVVWKVYRGSKAQMPLSSTTLQKYFPTQTYPVMPIAESNSRHLEPHSVPWSRLHRSASILCTARNKGLQFTAWLTWGVSLQGLGRPGLVSFATRDLIAVLDRSGDSNWEPGESRESSFGLSSGRRVLRLARWRDWGFEWDSGRIQVIPRLSSIGCRGWWNCI